MIKQKRVWALLLALAMVFALTACRSAGTEESQTPSEPVQSVEPVQPSEEATEPVETPSSVDQGGDVRLAVLSGPTGIGAAKLLSAVDNDPASLRTSYQYTIANDNSELVAGLTGPEPEFDIATVASNVALNLYNKTEGGVKIIALGTRGVLHILEGGGKTEIESIADLAGRTVYCAGQGANPEFILRYLLTENGLDPDKDVTLVFAEATEITAKLMSGEAECAMLPVPAATAAIIKSEGKIRDAVDLTQAWDGLNNGSQLIMTAVVARPEFVETYPDKVNAFLEDYAASVTSVRDDPEGAAPLVAELGITPNAAIAAKAIPQCNLDFIAGTDMSEAISDYYMVLYSIDPGSVGGALPDDAIYYVP